MKKKNIAATTIASAAAAAAVGKVIAVYVFDTVLRAREHDL